MFDTVLKTLVKAENVVNDPRNPMIKKFFIFSEIT